MVNKLRPAVEWALFCGHAERDSRGFLTLRRVQRSVACVPSEGFGINLFLAFGIWAAPQSQTVVRVTIERPDGTKAITSVIFQLSETGFADFAADLSPLVVSKIGEVRAEFRFGDESEPRHVAVLFVRDVDPLIPPVPQQSPEKTH